MSVYVESYVNILNKIIQTHQAINFNFNYGEALSIMVRCHKKKMMEESNVGSNMKMDDIACILRT